MINPQSYILLRVWYKSWIISLNAVCALRPDDTVAPPRAHPVESLVHKNGSFMRIRLSSSPHRPHNLCDIALYPAAFRVSDVYFLYLINTSWKETHVSFQFTDSFVRHWPSQMAFKHCCVINVFVILRIPIQMTKENTAVCDNFVHYLW